MYKRDKIALSIYTNWGKSIQRYNESLSEYSGSVAIIGYIIFSEDKNPDYDHDSKN